jgi:hypothetical protein
MEFIKTSARFFARKPQAFAGGIRKGKLLNQSPRSA